MSTIVSINSVAGNLLIHEKMSPHIKNSFNKNRNSPKELEEDNNTRRGMIEAGCLDIGSLVEHCMALQNPKLKRIQGAQNGCDFTDGSDAKMATIYATNTAQGYTSCRAMIRHIANKTGTLRCIIANTVTGEVAFFLIPYDVHSTYSDKVTICYSPSKNAYGKFEEYRVDTFEQLCSDYVAPVCRYMEAQAPWILSDCFFA